MRRARGAWPAPPRTEAEAAARGTATAKGAGVKKASKTRRVKEVSGALSSVARLADSLDEALAHAGAAAGADAKAPRKGALGAKARARLVVAETERFSAILAHAAFQQSPFEAIERHIANSVAAQAVERAAAQPVAPVARAAGAARRRPHSKRAGNAPGPRAKSASKPMHGQR